ncbi:MAG TPA: hypothetical protein GXX46_07700 [Peptococcaceae bacterium]|nr:hypothetical protein [Peptococcaceae bacterium]
MKTISSNQLELRAEDIYRAMGTGSSSVKISSNLLQKIKQYRSKAMKLLECTFTWRKLAVTSLTKTHVVLDNSYFFSCNGKYFGGATEVAVILLTVGSQIEQEIKRLYVNTNLLDGLILDAYANSALDEVFGIVRAYLEKEASFFHQKLGYSLSPGCHLPLEDQATVFSILKTESSQMGISLLNTYVMSPGKSCTYLIPIGISLIMPSSTKYACEICASNKFCLFSPLERKK